MVKTPGITISELMTISTLQNARVLSGENGMQRVVRCVDIMEVPDVKGWVREGVFMMTTAYSIRHDPLLLCDIIRMLDQSGAAGLAIKTTRFLKEVPSEAIAISNACGLPIIEIPPEVPYTDITQPVMDMVLNRQAVLLRRSEEIYHTLTTMVLENSGIQAVSDNVSSLLNAPVALIDIANRVIVASPPEWSWETAVDSRIFPIRVDKRTVARLVIARNELDDMEQVGIEQARLVMALELMREKAVEDTENRLRGNFIDELMTPPLPPVHEIERRGRKLGMNPEHDWEVAVIEGSVVPLEETLSRLLSVEMERRGVVPHVEFRSNRAVLFLPIAAQHKDGTEGRQAATWSDILEIWIKKKELGNEKYRIGIGSAKRLWELVDSYNEARNALSMSRRLFADRHVTRFEEIELHWMLGKAMNTQEFERLFERKLGMLRRYDQDHGSDLLKTFFHYLEKRGSLMETASSLFIHRNSVKYRLERIRDMTDFDLNDPREQLACHMCLIHYYMRQDGL